jgi:ubiquinone/menaquinone biosynthesis C-methylase UbiE
MTVTPGETSTSKKEPKANLMRLISTASKRLDSPENYREFQEVQGRMLLQYLEGQALQLRDRLVLDLGCGHGGYSSVFEAAGARVVCSDLMVDESISKGAVRISRMVRADATRLPLQDASVDFVFCASLIEHVPDSRALLSEIERVMKPGAKCYLSFPPFYTPIGGHQFKPFHLFGEKIAMALYRRANKDSTLETNAGFADAYGEWGLYRRTIRGVRGELATTGLRVLNQSTRYLPLNVSRIPCLSEFLTWHVQFILERDAA